MARARGAGAWTRHSASRASRARCSTGTGDDRRLRRRRRCRSTATASRLHVGRARHRRSRRRKPTCSSRPAPRWSSTPRSSARVGGFDERYFMFFEDVDLGWRLWLLGYRVRYVPASLVYHRHHASMAAIRHRGASTTCSSATRSSRSTRTTTTRTCARCCRRARCSRSGAGVALGGDDRTRSTCGRSRVRRALDTEYVSVHKQTLAATFAIDAFVERARRARRDPRRAPGGAGAAATRDPPRCSGTPFQPNIDAARVPSSGFDDRGVGASTSRPCFGARRRIVVATGDTLEPAMAGPAIRAWQIARALVARARRRARDAPSMRRALAPRLPGAQGDTATSCASSSTGADVIDLPGLPHARAPVLIATSSKVIVVDIYDPFHLEQLEQARDLAEPATASMLVRSSTDGAERAARARRLLPVRERRSSATSGSASSRRCGRINPLTYDDDESLDELARASCPFGVSDDPPAPHPPGAPGRRARASAPTTRSSSGAAGSTTGSIPLTLLRAVDKLRGRVPERSPVLPRASSTRTRTCPRCAWRCDARQLADELGLTGTHVFFNEGWVDVRGPPELPARGRRRRQHAPRPRRDGVLVPHRASSTTSGPAFPVVATGRRLLRRR